MPKPKSKKKRFIDPKRERTTTFALIHRSQKDPLAADADAPQLVLQEIPEAAGGKKLTNEELDQIKEEERKFGVFYEDEYNYLQHLKVANVPEYDYSEVDKFLLSKDDDVPSNSGDSPKAKPETAAERSSTSSGKKPNKGLNLPSEVFGTQSHEEEVGLLNKAAPHSLGTLLDWDPDIVETLDDAFEHEVVFTAKDLEKEMAEAEEGYDEEGDGDLDAVFREALAEGVTDDDDDDDEYEDIDSDDEDEEQDFDSDFGGRSDYEGDEEDDEVPELVGRGAGGVSFGAGGRGGNLFMEEETKSRFTEYSMSSSVIRRNKQLSILDEKFEEFFDNYDEMNVGGLEFDEIEGRLRPDIVKENKDGLAEEHPGDLVMKQVLDEYTKHKETERQKPPEIDATLNLVAASENATDNKKEEKELMEMFGDQPKDRFDCQSVLSTYSTIYNHPKLISERKMPKKILDPIQISGKTGMPKDVLGKGLTAGALKRLDRENEMMTSRNGHDDSDDSGSEDDVMETQTLASRMSTLSFRNKHETAEERRARKNGMKELKRERRMEKKANRAAFKDEQKRQEKIMISNKQNTQKIL